MNIEKGNPENDPMWQSSWNWSVLWCNRCRSKIESFDAYHSCSSDAFVSDDGHKHGMALVKYVQCYRNQGYLTLYHAAFHIHMKLKHLIFKKHNQLSTPYKRFGD